MSEGRSEELVRELFADELRAIADAGLRNNVVKTWTLAMRLTGVTDLVSELQSGQIYGEQKSGLAVEHTRSVTQIALGIARAIAVTDSIPVDLDVVAAGGLLHDAGKIFEQATESDHPLTGPLISHHFSGLYVAMECSIPREVLHIIAFHAREGHHHRRSLECHIVYRADALSVDALLRREVGKTASDVIPYAYLR
jgi:putative nucleotidyltransferase with HDIG domain